MFKVEAKDSIITFEWNVKFKWPRKGKHVDEAFTAIFKRMTTSDFLVATALIVEAESVEGENAIPQVQDLMQDVLLNFDKVEISDPETGEVMGHDDIMEFLIHDPAIVMAMYEGYNSAILGRELTEKNSAGQLDA